MLDHLVDEVDGVDHVALLLLVIMESGTEQLVGLARTIRDPDDPTAADVAVTVLDDWQGRGVATVLLEVLMRRRPKGVERIVTVINAGNAASLAMLRRLGEVKVNRVNGGPSRSSSSTQVGPTGGHSLTDRLPGTAIAASGTTLIGSRSKRRVPLTGAAG